MNTRFRFPRNPWRAAERTERSPEQFIDAPDYMPDAPGAFFVGSTFADESNQGRGPSGSAWRITDALIAALFVSVVAWIVMGCPT